MPHWSMPTVRGRGSSSVSGARGLPCSLHEAVAVASRRRQYQVQSLRQEGEGPLNGPSVRRRSHPHTGRELCCCAELNVTQRGSASGKKRRKATLNLKVAFLCARNRKITHCETLRGARDALIIEGPDPGSICRMSTAVRGYWLRVIGTCPAAWSPSLLAYTSSSTTQYVRPHT